MSEQGPLFGELLIRLGLVEPAQLEEALALQSLTGQRVGEALISLGYVRRDQLRRALMEALGLTGQDGLERPKLGELLVKLKHVTRAQVEEALARQKQEGRRIGEILVDLGHCSFKHVYEALGLQQENPNKPVDAPPPSGAQRVMVVDDSPLALALVQEGLTQHGFDVVTFEDPFVALEEVGRINPSIVLSDLQMPGMDGPELCRRLKDGPARAVPVIILTANDNEAERVGGLRAGADDYVSKTASLEELAVRIETVLRRTGETERMRKLFARYTSDAVVDEILKHPGEFALGGDRREVTILFADLRNFTGLSDALAPEQVVQILNAVLGRLSDAVLTCGGTLDKFLGDGLMAVFGAPVRRDDDALRAVQAAQIMMRLVAELNADQALAFAEGRRLDQPAVLNLGIGINSGPVVAGNIGSALRTEYTVIGDAVNVAARLCALAESQEILVGQRTCELVNSAGQFQELPPVRLKGKPKPVPVFRAS